MKTFLVCVLVLVSQVTSFDVIRDGFKYIDDNVAPCDNFYRHVCPINNIPELYIANAYREKLFRAKTKSVNAIWNNLEIEKTFIKTHYKELPEPQQFIADLFYSQCEDDSVQLDDRKQFLKTIERVMFGQKDDSDCNEESCLRSLAYDKNCARSANILKERLALMVQFDQFQKNWAAIFFVVKEGLNGINVILDDDLREGVSTIQYTVEQMKTILMRWVEETSWASNNQAVEAIVDEAEQVHLYDNFGKKLRDTLQFVLSLEQTYLKCLRDMKNDNPDFEIFCMLVTTAVVEPYQVPRPDFFTFFNAMNAHPKLYFSYLFYDMAKNIEEEAAMFGSAGFVMGHELSHSLIENANNPRLIPYFSNESMQCIQNQYQKTCDSFKEVSCEVNESQIDENGADILGIQLAYSLFEETYENKTEDVYIELKDGSEITMEKLFFYGIGFVFCHGSPGAQRERDPHSALNVRVNAVLQHPGFRKAFKCDSDSRMVQSFNDQCVIFGEDAPQRRRRAR